MESLELIYEQQVLLEGKITDWFKKYPDVIYWIKDHADAVKEAFLSWVEKHGGIKQVVAGGAGAVMVASSPVVMAAYFHKFFQQNPETLDYPIQFLEKASQVIAQFIIEHPNFLEFLKRITGN